MYGGFATMEAEVNKPGLGRRWRVGTRLERADADEGLTPLRQRAVKGVRLAVAGEKNSAAFLEASRRG